VLFPLLSFSLFLSSSFSSTMLCHLLFFWPNFSIYSFFFLLCLLLYFRQWLFGSHVSQTLCFTQLKVKWIYEKYLYQLRLMNFRALITVCERIWYVSSNRALPLIRLYFVIAMTNNKSLQFNTTSWVEQPVCGYCSIRNFTLQNRPLSSGSHFCAILLKKKRTKRMRMEQ